MYMYTIVNQHVFCNTDPHSNISVLRITAKSDILHCRGYSIVDISNFDKNLACFTLFWGQASQYPISTYLNII